MRASEVLPAGQGEPATVVLDPPTGLEGSTGQTLWRADASSTLLDIGRGTTGPRLLSTSDSATVCRRAVSNSRPGSPPLTADYPARAGRNEVDPRWARPLPWTVIEIGDTRWFLLPKWFHIMHFPEWITYGIVNLAGPFAVLRLASRNRRRGIRQLLALPLAAAFPLTTFAMLWSRLAQAPDVSFLDVLERFARWTVYGIPFAVYAILACSLLLRKRWRRMASLVATTLVLSAAIGITWLLLDTPAKAPLEHYTSSGWFDIVLLGAYALGAVMLVQTLAKAAAELRNRLLPLQAPVS
jgi:hypothetical protein